jgi:hypothetical protein
VRGINANIASSADNANNGGRVRAAAKSLLAMMVRPMPDRRCWHCFHTHGTAHPPMADSPYHFAYLDAEEFVRS